MTKTTTGTNVPVTDEMVDTAARAEWDQYKPDLDGGPWEGLTEAQREAWREGVEVVLAAAIPLVTPAIKAEALREAADAWQWGEWSTITEPAKRPEVVGQVPRILGIANAVTDWIRARADRIEKENA